MEVSMDVNLNKWNFINVLMYVSILYLNERLSEYVCMCVYVSFTDYRSYCVRDLCMYVCMYVCIYVQ